MRTAHVWRGLAAFALAVLASSATRPSDASQARDPLADEIARWTAFLSTDKGSAAMWEDVKKASGPVLARAEQARRDGRRLLAIQRLAAAREGLAASQYVFSLDGPQRNDRERFEAEWRAVGERLRAELAPPAADALAGIAPLALRAIGEASLPQVRIYYEASLDYGRSTVFDAGLYYMGSALAQRELPALLTSLADPKPAAPFPQRSLEPELRELESEILAAYRPPVSIDRHVDFIRASAAVKEARELDALGLRHGALLRYLQGVQRFAPVRPSGDAAPLEPGFADYDARLRAGERDHTIGRLFLETAQALAGPGDGADPAAARAILESVLPRYFAALEPRAPLAGPPAARATVTLVRWPYT
jgi:hypothetical protein